MANSSSLFDFGRRRRAPQPDERDATIARLEAENARLREAMGKATETSRRIAHGDFEARITHIGHLGDAIPFLQALNRAFDLTDVFIRESVACLDHAAKGHYYRPFLETGMTGAFRQGARTMNETRNRMKAMRDEARSERLRLAADFEASIGEVAASLGGAAGTLTRATDGVAAIAVSTQEQAQAVAAAAEEASVSSETVAAAVTELSASIGEISRQVQIAGDLSQTVATEAGSAGETVAELARATQAIDDVVRIIQVIANQTNLLALNATIEAARAGESGKGFAVVAAEVKALARQTAEATVKAAAQAEEMRDWTQSAVQGIGRITTATESLTTAATAISSAVEQQTAATREISQSVDQVAAGTREVSANIIEVSGGATRTAQAASGMRGGAEDIARLTDRLHADVDLFLAEVRNT